MKHNYILIAIFLFITISINSQNSQNFCGFDQSRAKKMKDPVFAKNAKLFEAKLQEKIKAIKARGLNKTTQTQQIIQLPVVFHIVHLGEPVGTGSNISDQQVIDALNRLTDFYRGRNSSNTEDFGFEFVLAKRDQKNNASNGIVRHDFSGNATYVSQGVMAWSSNLGISSDDIFRLGWQARDYFNIYIVTEFDNGTSGLRAGSSFYHDTNGQGIMMTYSTLIDPSETTFAHETGHYFNLYHPHQGDGLNWLTGVSTKCPADTMNDFVADTEPYRADNHTVTGGDDTINYCTGQPWVDNLTNHNVMSYLPTPELLSPGQKVRSRGVVEGSNWSKSTGKLAPDPNFVSPVAANCTPAQPTRVTNNDGIVNVAINGKELPTQSAYGDGIMTNFTNYSFDETKNSNSLFTIDGTTSYNISVTFPDTAIFNHQLGVWIDWNNDGDFNDDNEQQSIQDHLDFNTTTVQIPIKYPTTVPFNSYVRIRLIADIASNYNMNGAIASSCFSPREGQSEDYTISVNSNALSTDKFQFDSIIVFVNNDTHQININGNLERATKAYLYDIQGRLLQKQNLKITNTNNKINTSNLSTGIYILKLDDGIRRKSEKLFIQ